jgi:hypothetical protein
VELVVLDDSVLDKVLIPVLTLADDDDEVEAEAVELDDTMVSLEYTDRRLPAPQYSRLFPEHRKLQSEAGAGTEPAPNSLPQ